jgi:A/G-specific adenine glycosylase
VQNDAERKRSLSRLRYLSARCAFAGEQGQNAFPWRRRRSLYRTLVAEVLLQHTPVARVVPVFERMTRTWTTAAALAAARALDVERILSPLGLQRRRSRSLRLLARDIRGWRISKIRLHDYRHLAGVGPYTAGVSYAVTHNKPAGFMDAGMERMLRRYLGEPRISRATLVNHVLATTQLRAPRLVAWGLLDLSRTVCAGEPKCLACPLRRRCQAVVTAQVINS